MLKSKSIHCSLSPRLSTGRITNRDHWPTLPGHLSDRSLGSTGKHDPCCEFKPGWRKHTDGHGNSHSWNTLISHCMSITSTGCDRKLGRIKDNVLRGTAAIKNCSQSDRYKGTRKRREGGSFTKDGKSPWDAQHGQVNTTARKWAKALQAG